MYRGKIVAIVDGRTADRNEVGILMATGVRQEAAVASGAISPEEAAAAATAVAATTEPTGSTSADDGPGA
jgi:hypothetical protein